MRRQVPVFITGIVGVILIFAFFIPHHPFGALGEDMTVFFDIVAVFAFILGGGNLIKIHGNKIYRRSRDWPFSIVTVGGFFLMLWADSARTFAEAGVGGLIFAEVTGFVLILAIALAYVWRKGGLEWDR